MKHVLLAIALATPAHADCTLSVNIHTSAAHGTLGQGTLLTARLDYAVTRALSMGSEARAYLTDGMAEVIGPDGTGLRGRLGVIHVVRSPHWADYMSFDIVEVSGDLGGVTTYEDPMLITFYAARGALTSFDLPNGSDDWARFDQRMGFQVHTPDTMWTLPGVVSAPEGSCDP